MIDLNKKAKERGEEDLTGPYLWVSESPSERISNSLDSYQNRVELSSIAPVPDPTEQAYREDTSRGEYIEYLKANVRSLEEENAHLRHNTTTIYPYPSVHLEEEPSELTMFLWGLVIGCSITAIILFS